MAPLWVCCIILMVVVTIQGQVPDELRDNSSYSACWCPDGDVEGSCECVYFSRCDATTKFIISDTSGVKYRTGRKLERCPKSEVCCYIPTDADPDDYEDSEEIKPTITTPTITTPPTTTPTTTTRRPNSIGTAPRKTNTSRMLDSVPKNIKGGCGVRRSMRNKRVFSDDPDTTFGEFPWMVGVYNISKVPSFMCAGTLISHQVVLTAAHCVFRLRPEQIGIFAGQWNVIKRVGTESGKISKTIIHENFDPATIVNDVALLVLQKALPNKVHIDTICLPQKGDNFIGRNCIIAGWGTQSGDKDNYKPTLSKAELPVLQRRDCRDKLRKTKLGRYFRLDKSFVCAGGTGNSACLKDGGGPLMCPSEKDPERYIQAGIIAGGLSCGFEDIPDLFADVSYLSDWILDKLDQNDLTNEAIPT